MKKLVQIALVLLLFVPSLSVRNVKAAETEKPLIIETVRCDPDPVKLLEEEVRYTQNWETKCSDSTIQLSYEDAQRLMNIAWAEAGNQGVIGQLKVCEVVVNRMYSENFPDTIQEVIEQPGQFSTVTNGIYQNAKPTWETHTALAILESNHDHDWSIYAFESAGSNSLERYFDPLYQYGDHMFYTLKD